MAAAAPFRDVCHVQYIYSRLRVSIATRFVCARVRARAHGLHTVTLAQGSVNVAGLTRPEKVESCKVSDALIRSLMLKGKRELLWTKMASNGKKEM